MPPVPVCRFRTLVVLAVCGLVYGTGGVSGQPRARTTSLSGVPAVPLPDEPVVLYSAEQPRIRVVPITTELSHPWGPVSYTHLRAHET